MGLASLVLAGLLVQVALADKVYPLKRERLNKRKIFRPFFSFSTGWEIGHHLWETSSVFNHSQRNDDWKASSVFNNSPRDADWKTSSVFNHGRITSIYHGGHRIHGHQVSLVSNNQRRLKNNSRITQDHNQGRKMSSLYPYEHP